MGCIKNFDITEIIGPCKEIVVYSNSGEVFSMSKDFFSIVENDIKYKITAKDIDNYKRHNIKK